MKLFIPNEEAINNKVFGEMVMSVVNQGSRGTGFVYQQRDGRGWFSEYPASMPSHLMYGWANKHHMIVLRYNYQCFRKKDGVSITLDNVKLFYPAGVFIPFRIYKHGDEWKLFNYANNDYGYSGIYGKGYPLFDKKGNPVFPKQLMVDTFPQNKPIVRKADRFSPEKDEDFHWKGLASSYIMG